MKENIYTLWANAKQQAFRRFETENVILIEAFFEGFEVWQKGKGSGRQYWDYEVVFEDKERVPALWTDYENPIDLKPFLNQKVRLEAAVFYGVLIGDPDDMESQQLTGYRIDIKAIQLI